MNNGNELSKWLRPQSVSGDMIRDSRQYAASQHHKVVAKANEAVERYQRNREFLRQLELELIAAADSNSLDSIFMLYQLTLQEMNS